MLGLELYLKNSIRIAFQEILWKFSKRFFQKTYPRDSCSCISYFYILLNLLFYLLVTKLFIRLLNIYWTFLWNGKSVHIDSFYQRGIKYCHQYNKLPLLPLLIPLLLPPTTPTTTTATTVVAKCKFSKYV